MSLKETTYLAEERNNAQLWGPPLKFTDPVGKRGVWNNYKSREDVPSLHQSSDERGNLHGFALMDSVNGGIES